MTGTIAHVVRQRLFGFIRADGRDFFFHKADLEDLDFNDLAKEDVVEFEPGESAKGLRAIRVRAPDALAGADAVAA